MNGGFYSVPWRWVGKSVEAHLYERRVEIYAGQQLISTHVRLRKKGEWSTRMEDYPPHKAAYLIQTPAYCRHAAARIGPAAKEVVDHLLSERPLDRIRSVQAILRLEDTVGAERLEAACKRAAFFGDMRYRRIKDILNAALDRQPLPEPLVEHEQRSFTFARKPSEFFGRKTDTLQ